MVGRTILVGGLVLVLMLVLVAGWAMADSARHISVAATTMQAVDSSIRYDSYDGYLRTVQESTMNEQTVYVGQVDLPDGASVVGVRAFGLDSDPVSGFCFGLVRVNLDEDPAPSAVSDVVCTGGLEQPGKVELEAPVQSGAAVVDNATYSYVIHLLLPSPYNLPYQDLGVLRFLVDASYRSNVPLIGRN